MHIQLAPAIFDLQINFNVSRLLACPLPAILQATIQRKEILTRVN